MSTPANCPQTVSDKDFHLSGWGDLNSRPLDPKIGPPQLSSVNHLSLVSMLDPCGALRSAVVVRSWSVLSPTPMARP
jgi:hypothetical protein